MMNIFGEKPPMRIIKERQASNNENADLFSTRTRLILLGLILLFVVLIRVRLLDVPLERDEGEYAYTGQLMLQGVPPYSAAYSMKLPGTSLAYAGIMSVFGLTTQGIHLGLIVLNCATIVLLFHLGRKLMNDFSAVIASGAYAVLSLSSSVFGFAAHSEHFVALPAIGGAFLLLSAMERDRPSLYFLSGTVFGLAFLMKQPGLFFIAFGVSYMIYHSVVSKPRHSFKKISLQVALFTSGALLPFLATVLWLYASGVFDKFWFWTVQYAMQYGVQIPAFQVLGNFKDGLFTVIDGFFLLWIISAAGFIVLFFERDLKANRIFIILFTLFSFLSICPGFYFRQHYFVMLLPALSLSAGILVYYLNAKAVSFFKSPYAKFAGTAIFIAALLIGIGYQRRTISLKKGRPRFPADSMRTIPFPNPWK
jgi:4-amino-4-deoxy-L-arabinose transferase-like glycosyltransferase